ncbi:MAG: hypothetical protein MJY42_03880 [Bacteroidales bacterium]|nr:hypothetical protein [Bacteroidales bacterium]
MKRITFAAAIAVFTLLSSVSCGKKELPAEQQLVIGMIENVSSGIKNISFTSFEQVDSTTVIKELERRQALFRSKVKIEGRYVKNYEEKRMMNNAAKHRKSLEQAEAILADLEEYGKSLESCRDSIVYRTFCFSCTGTHTDGSSFHCDEMFVNILPDGTACNLTSDRNYHTGMGRTLPGYTAILEKHRFSEE